MDTLTNGDKLITDKSETIYIGCQCHGPEHIIQVKYYDQTSTDEPELYFMLQADNGHLNLWERVKMAFDFLIGRGNIEWHDVIPNHDDVVNLKRVLDNYIEDYKDYNAETQDGSN